MEPWSSSLERYFMKKIMRQYEKNECFFNAMGWTEDKWDEPIFGAMQKDMDRTPMANLLENTEGHCKSESDEGKDGGKFMR